MVPVDMAFSVLLVERGCPDSIESDLRSTSVITIRF